MREESRKRSVDNLQRLYTVVISLAVTEVLRRVLSVTGDTGELPDYASVVAAVSLIITIVPFYHGANRYLDSTYVTGERSAKSATALMVDFIALLLEGIAFFILAVLVRITTAFFFGLALLFVFDALWVWLTKLTSSSQADRGSEYHIWAVANICAALLLFISFASTLPGLLTWNLWTTDTARLTAALIIAAVRTGVDYGTVMPFYYPLPPDVPYIMPIPRPAVAPSREGTPYGHHTESPDAALSGVR